MQQDKGYLLDILEAGKRIVSKTGSVTQEQFLSDEDTQDIVMRQITIMGEAARNVSDELKSRSQSIPWHLISGMRNRLVHEYREIDFEEVWKTSREDIPELIIEIEKLI